MNHNRYLKQAVFRFCLFFFCIAPGYGAADIGPDLTVHADLKKTFEQPAQIRGYPYQDLVQSASVRYELPLPFVLAVIRGESFFDPKAKSAKGAIGLMQVLPTTAADYGVSPELLLDPATNIDVGVHYLSDLFHELEDPYLTLAAYYCGPGRVDKKDFVLSSECDEYVHYIHAHLQKILSGIEGRETVTEPPVSHFAIAKFDSFLDAERFSMYLAKKLPQIQLDLFRREVVHPDHIRFEYQILAAQDTKDNRTRICKEVEKATGFSLCQ